MVAVAFIGQLGDNMPTGIDNRADGRMARGRQMKDWEAVKGYSFWHITNPDGRTLTLPMGVGANRIDKSQSIERAKSIFKARDMRK